MGQSESTSNSPKPHEPKRAFNTLDASSSIHPTSHVVHSNLKNWSNVIDAKVAHSTLVNAIVCCGADVAHCNLTGVRICGGKMRHTTARGGVFKGCDIAFGGFEDCELEGMVCQHEKSKGQKEEGVGKEMEGHDPVMALGERVKVREMEKELERERGAQVAAISQGGGSSGASHDGELSATPKNSEVTEGRNQDLKDGENEAAIPLTQTIPHHAPPPYEVDTSGPNWVTDKEKRS